MLFRKIFLSTLFVVISGVSFADNSSTSSTPGGFGISGALGILEFQRAIEKIFPDESEYFDFHGTCVWNDVSAGGRALPTTWQALLSIEKIKQKEKTDYDDGTYLLEIPDECGNYKISLKNGGQENDHLFLFNGKFNVALTVRGSISGDLSYLCLNCSRLVYADFRALTTKDITNVSYMFSACTRLFKIVVSPDFLSNFLPSDDLYSNYSNAKGVFDGCNKTLIVSTEPGTLSPGFRKLVEICGANVQNFEYNPSDVDGENNPLVYHQGDEESHNKGTYYWAFDAVEAFVKAGLSDYSKVEVPSGTTTKVYGTLQCSKDPENPTEFASEFPDDDPERASSVTFFTGNTFTGISSGDSTDHLSLPAYVTDKDAVYYTTGGTLEGYATFKKGLIAKTEIPNLDEWAENRSILSGEKNSGGATWCAMAISEKDATTLCRLIDASSNTLDEDDETDTDDAYDEKDEPTTTDENKKNRSGSGSGASGSSSIKRLRAMSSRSKTKTGTSTTTSAITKTRLENKGSEFGVKANIYNELFESTVWIPNDLEISGKFKFTGDNSFFTQGKVTIEKGSEVVFEGSKSLFNTTTSADRSKIVLEDVLINSKFSVNDSRVSVQGEVTIGPDGSFIYE